MPSYCGCAISLKACADKHGARIKIVEVPPGPPVLSTLVAEVYPKPGRGYDELRTDTRHVRELFGRRKTGGRGRHVRAATIPIVFRVDREKASLSGVSTEDIANTLRVGLQGMAPGEGSVQHIRAASGPLAAGVEPALDRVATPPQPSEPA